MLTETPTIGGQIIVMNHLGKIFSLETCGHTPSFFLRIPVTPEFVHEYQHNSKEE